MGKPGKALVALTMLLLAAPAFAAAPAKRTPEVWHPQLVAIDPPGDRALEIGSALSASGYEKLRKALAWEEGKARTDYYFDGFDGKKLVIRSGAMPLKVRLKMKKKGPEWQVARFTSKDRVQVGPLSIKVHVTESWEGKLRGKQAKAFVAATEAFFAKLDAGGAPLRLAADQVDKAYRAVVADGGFPGQAAMDHYLGKGPWKFVPTKGTPNKRRLEARLPGFAAAEVTLQLGREDERGADGKAVTVYELEAEADRQLSAAEARAAAQVLGAWMLKAGIMAADLETPTVDGRAYMLKQLAKP